ncbi:MAG: SCO family protein [Kangiellaceae bacterium]|nr:SCO family protein [Kangiellaceae bacterium]
MIFKAKYSTGSSRVAIIIAALFSLMVGASVYKFLFAEKQMELIRTFEQPRSLDAFSAQDHKSNPFNEKNFLGKWSLVFFGFTTCPDVCPTAMSNLNQVLKKVDTEFLVDTQVVMVSVDPERDTLERLAKYVPAFNKDFIGIRGSIEETRKLTQSIGVSFFKVPGHDDPNNYLVEHTARWFIIDPLGRRFALISPDEVGPKEDLISLVASDYNILRSQVELK